MYTGLKKLPNLKMELNKFCITECDISEYSYNLICYTKDRAQHELVYRTFDQFDRDKVPSIIITSDTSYESAFLPTIGLIEKL